MGDADLYWNLTDDTKQWVTHSIDKTTGAITTYNRTDVIDSKDDGIPLVTVFPATYSLD